MGQVLHGSATTTAAVRRAIQHSQESLRALASRYGVNQKTIAKWRQRSTVDDLPTGPKQARSTVLSVEDEAIVVAFRRHTLLPLDDCLYALQATIGHLTRSSLHRCLQRHDISRLPEVEGTTPVRRKFKAYPLGTFHIDIAEVHTAQGRLYLLVAIDRTTKFAFVELHEKATRSIAGHFLRALIRAIPYRIHTVLSDNGTHFTSPGNVRSAAAEIRRAMDNHEQFRAHAFEYACAQNHIDHRLTKPRHPWTNGQVERMGRTLKDATVKRFHYETHDQLRSHLADFVGAYNFGRRLKTLKGLTPYEAICKTWTSDPGRFTLDPFHQMLGLNTPNLSPNGTFVVVDAATVAFRGIRSPGTLRNLAANPAVEVNFVDSFTRYGCRLIGSAQIVARGEAKFDRLLPLFFDYGDLVPRFWAVVVVTVMRALPLSSPVYDGGATEDEVRQSWTERFHILQPDGRFVK